MLAFVGTNGGADGVTGGGATGESVLLVQELNTISKAIPLQTIDLKREIFMSWSAWTIQIITQKAEQK